MRGVRLCSPTNSLLVDFFLLRPKHPFQSPLSRRGDPLLTTAPSVSFRFLRTNRSNLVSVHGSVSPALANGTTVTAGQSSRPRETSESGRSEADGMSSRSTLTARSQLGPGAGAGSSETLQTAGQMSPAAGSGSNPSVLRPQGMQQLTAVTFAANAPVLAVGKGKSGSKLLSASNYHKDLHCYNYSTCIADLKYYQWCGLSELYSDGHSPSAPTPRPPPYPPTQPSRYIRRLDAVSIIHA